MKYVAAVALGVWVVASTIAAVRIAAARHRAPWPREAVRAALLWHVKNAIGWLGFVIVLIVQPPGKAALSVLSVGAVLSVVVGLPLYLELLDIPNDRRVRLLRWLGHVTRLAPFAWLFPPQWTFLLVMGASTILAIPSRRLDRRMRPYYGDPSFNRFASRGILDTESSGRSVVGSGEGISLTEDQAINLGVIRDLYALLAAIDELMPEGAVLYVEETSMAPDIQAFLEAHPAEESRPVVRGTLWPRPRTYHLPLIGSYLRQLRDLAEAHAEPEICDHLVVYRGDEVLLSAYDAGSGYVYVSRDLSPEAVDGLRHRLVIA